MDERERSEGAVFLSWLELTAMLDVLDFSHPIEISDHGCTVWAHPSQVLPGHHGQLTVAARIRFIKGWTGVLIVGWILSLSWICRLFERIRLRVGWPFLFPLRFSSGLMRHC